MSNTSVLAFAGRAGAGKSTCANVVLDLAKAKGIKVYKWAFARPLYEMLAVIEASPLSPSWPDTFGKETPIPWLADRSFRYLIQTLGTEWGRELVDPNIWVSLCARRYHAFRSTCREQKGLFVIDDLRFANEQAWVKSVNGTIAFVDRPDLVVDPKTLSHASENSFDPALSDVTIHNNACLSQLEKQLADLIPT